MIRNPQPKKRFPIFFLLFCMFCDDRLSAQTIYDLRNGVTAYWSFDENFRADLGGAGFDLLAAGTGPAAGPTISGTQPVFNGAAWFVRSFSDYLRTPPGALVNPDNADFTYYVRYMPAEALANNTRYFVMESSQTEHAISFGLRRDASSSNIPRSEVYSQNASSSNNVFLQPNAAGNYGVTINTWHNIIVVYTSSDKTYRFWLNGIAAGSLVQSGVLKAGGLIIGSFRSFSGRFWQGAIDEVTLWSRALSTQEISAVQNVSLKIALQKAVVTATLPASASFSISSGENLSVHYKVVPASGGCPVASTLIIDPQATTVSLNNTTTIQNAASLAPETEYKICQVAVDQAGSVGALLETDFVTSSTLPLTWKSFTALREKEDIVLKWETVNEQNTSSFIVERSSDGHNFSALTKLPAQRKESNAYNWIDIQPGKGSFFYRIRQTDNDDRFTYSIVVQVAKVATISGLQVLSNPIKNKQVHLKLSNAATVSLLRIDGKLVLVKKLAAGNNILDIPIIQTGIYILQADQISTRVYVE